MVIAWRSAVAAVLCLTVLLHGAQTWAEPTARRGTDLLERARAEIANVRYAAAAEALDLALAAGDNDARDLVEIYRLRGRVFAALGRKDAAIRSFERMFALNPDADIGARVAPKIMAPFNAAAAHKPAPLRVRVAVVGRTIKVLVEQDPLALITSVRASFRVDGVSKTVVANGRGTFRLDLPPTGQLDVVVTAHDIHKNRLVDLSTRAAPLIVNSADKAPSTTDTSSPSRGSPESLSPKSQTVNRPAQNTAPRADTVTTKPRPIALYKRWYFYGGVSVALGLVGSYYGLQAQSGEDALGDFTEIPQAHDYADDVLPAVDSAQHDATRATVLFIGSAATAAITAALYIRERRTSGRIVISPTASTQSAGVMLHGSF